MCSARRTLCEYSSIGCDWTGPLYSRASYVVTCEFSSKTGQQLIDIIRSKYRAFTMGKKSLKTTLGLLSLHEIDVNSVTLKPHRTDDFAAKLHYESTRFTSLEHQWQVHVRINDNTSHLHTSNTRWLSYQLVLKSKVNETIHLAFLIVKDSLR